MIIALIPARGGSKRLPRKNLRSFAGKPLLEWSIETALRVPAIACCYVSTDDEEIAQVASASGAEVIRRPAELASDTATTASVAHHALRSVELMGHAVSGMVTLQPTAPLRTDAIVTDAIRLFISSGADSVVSVTRNHRKTGRIVDQCFVPDYVPGTRSQDLPPSYFENGVVYVTKASMLRQSGDLFGQRIAPLEIDAMYAMGDIDNEPDFAVAEHLFLAHRERFGP